MYELRPLTHQDLDQVLAWRNRPDVRANMYTTHVISPEEHQAYFERIKDDPSKVYLICIDAEAQPVGVVYFFGISATHKNAMWGFYSGDASRRGIGSGMEFLALNYAFETLGLDKLSCEVLSFNAPVIRFHRKFGFRIEGIFRRQYHTGTDYADIYRLAMFKKDWLDHLQAEARRKLAPKTELDANGRLEPGATYSRSFTITEDQIRRFAEVSGDFNPVHLDAEEAQRQGFAGVIGHGLLSASVFSSILGMEFPGPGTIYLRQTLAFKQPVYPGQALVASLKVVTRIGRRLILETLASDMEQNVLLEGEAEVVVPEGMADERP